MSINTCPAFEEQLQGNTHLNYWLRAVPPEDRHALQVTGDWLRQIQWQYFATITFPWNVTDSTANSYFRRWMDTIEQTLRTRVCYVAGMERGSLTARIRIPWHFHVLVTALVPIPADLLEGAWQHQVAAHGNIQPCGLDVPALVEPYEVHRSGPEYCLKKMNDCHGEWQFRWLEYFLPGQPGASRPNGRSIRQHRRFLHQVRRITPPGSIRPTPELSQADH